MQKAAFGMVNDYVRSVVHFMLSSDLDAYIYMCMCIFCGELDMGVCEVSGPMLCTVVPGVWKLSETIWQPAFQKI